MRTRFQHAKHVVAELRAAASRVIVKISGGKDSAVVLHLVRQVFDPGEIVAVYQYLAPGLRVCEAPLERLAHAMGLRVAEASASQDWGGCLVMVPHVEAVNALQTALLRPPQFPELERAPIVASHQIDDWMRRRAGTRWIVDGQRAQDSPHRRGMISRWGGGFDAPHGRAHPLARWNSTQVFQYCARHRLPHAPMLGTRRRSSGVSWSPDVLLELREQYPADYARICDTYPHAKAICARAELFSSGRSTDNASSGSRVLSNTSGGHRGSTIQPPPD